MLHIRWSSFTLSVILLILKSVVDRIRLFTLALSFGSVNKRIHVLPKAIMLYCHMQIHAHIYIYMLDTYRRNDRQTQEGFFNKIFTSHFIARVRKGYSRFAWERVLETEHNCNILTPLLWPSTLCPSRSPDAQPEALGSTLLGVGFLYCILSASCLDPNSSGPQVPSAWCGFPYHITLQLELELFLDWVIYIIV